jgi:urease accessory protein
MVSVLREPETRAGWQAELDLAFQGRAGRTAMTLNRHRGPLQVQKALYPEGAETCHVAVLHPPGGIAAGDELRVSADLTANARALLTTPGATKWYRSEGRCASQSLRFSLAEDCALEWLPRENILFDGSDVSLMLDIELQPGAKYLGWDIYCLGRRASGEGWHRGRLRMHSRISANGKLLWSEVANVAAGSEFAASSIGLAGYSVCGTFLAVGGGAEEWVKELRLLDPPAAARVGITALPGMLIGRYLGDSSEQAFTWFTSLWTASRLRTLGKAAQPPRVWAC